jgi:hypothetical protein
MGRALSCFYTLEFSLQLRKIMETFSPVGQKCQSQFILLPLLPFD